jgi:ribosomal protein RSM22 (predicted rRNA methylase)
MLPAALSAAILALTEGQKLSRLATRQSAVSDAYRAGAASAGVIDSAEAVAAYLLARLPATYAAVEYALGELGHATPEFAPASILDAGCGPGTAGFAALEAYPAAKSLIGIDHNPRFLAIAQRLAAHAGATQTRAVFFQSGDVSGTIIADPADLVLASYALVEMDEVAAIDLVRRLWNLSRGALALVEPGSQAGFARLKSARAALIAAGATILAPCTHHAGCPMPAGDWCHFSVRLPRSRAHQAVKNATMPYEDEKFSYLVAARAGAPAFAGRIVAPVIHGKAGHRVPLCETMGLHERLVSTRDPAFKAAKKWQWGDGI